MLAAMLVAEPRHFRSLSLATCSTLSFASRTGSLCGEHNSSKAFR
uniref:Uncharacterized protein n=1 Tax=Anguilla anguilla TaxID=7936 RepID=A0A0E9SJX7_ANGAN